MSVLFCVALGALLLGQLPLRLAAAWRAFGLRLVELAHPIRHLCRGGACRAT
jgi:hypothetical protein